MDDIIKKNKVGLVGLVIAFIALGIAIIHFTEGSFNSTTPTVEESITKKASLFRDTIVSKLKGEV